jgi:serine/threonine-protein kinase
MQAAEGLDACQRENLIHGLLKPSNLMLGADGQVRILDFGIGCLLAESEGESLVDTMSTANSVASGLDCASPESIMDPTNLTSAGDQYSLGCVLYFCLTGRYPFPDGSAAEKMMAHQLKQPESIEVFSPDVPPELIDVVKRLMQKDPEKRFGSIADVIEVLRPFAPLASAAPRMFARSSRLREAPKSARAPAGPSSDTPRPAQAAAHRPGTSSFPGRKSVRNPAPATPKVVADEPAPELEAEPEAAAAPKRQQHSYNEESPRRSWEERLGPLGIALGAIVACAVAWLVAWRFFQ